MREQWFTLYSSSVDLSMGNGHYWRLKMAAFVIADSKVEKVDEYEKFEALAKQPLAKSIAHEVVIWKCSKMIFGCLIGWWSLSTPAWILRAHS